MAPSVQFPCSRPLSWSDGKATCGPIQRRAVRRRARFSYPGQVIGVTRNPDRNAFGPPTVRLNWIRINFDSTDSNQLPRLARIESADSIDWNWRGVARWIAVMEMSGLKSNRTDPLLSGQRRVA